MKGATFSPSLTTNHHLKGSDSMADEQPIKRNWRFKDLTGQKFGKLTVLAFSHTSEHSKKTMWKCRCDDGNEITVIGNNLVRGIVTSCGCERSRINKEKKTKHGHGGAVNSHGEQTRRPTAEYIAWQHAKDRCHNPDNADYANYGGRGISMCEEWFNSFEAFYAHVGPKPKNTSLNRIDNDSGYNPGNVEWATRTSQANNRRPRRWWKQPKSIL